MRKFITSTLLKLVRMLVNKQVMDSIMELVRAQFYADKPGLEKKEAVEAALAELKGDVARSLAATSGYLINLAIEATVTYLVAKYGEDK